MPSRIRRIFCSLSPRTTALCEITDTPLPAELELDGQSHLPLLFGPPGQELRRVKPLQWHHYNTNVHASPNPNAVMRLGDHVICGFYDRDSQLKRASWNDRHFEQIKTGRLTRFELYKLSADPAQRHNIAERDPERFAALKKRLQTAHRAMQVQALGWNGTRPIQDLP